MEAGFFIHKGQHHATHHQPRSIQSPNPSTNPHPRAPRRSARSNQHPDPDLLNPRPLPHPAHRHRQLDRFPTRHRPDPNHQRRAIRADRIQPPSPIQIRHAPNRQRRLLRRPRHRRAQSIQRPQPRPRQIEPARHRTKSHPRDRIACAKTRPNQPYHEPCPTSAHTSSSQPTTNAGQCG